jgi:hypothetical protein
MTIKKNESFADLQDSDGDHPEEDQPGQEPINITVNTADMKRT